VKENVMASVAHRHALPAWLEPKAKPRARRPKALVRREAVDQAKPVGLVEQFVELAVAIPAAVISSIVPFLLYAGAILLFPFLPFLAPLFLAAPLVLLLSLTVRAFGAVLTAIGWL
jgi:hypothetical protein